MSDTIVENIDAYVKTIQGLDRVTLAEEIELADKIKNGTPAEKQAARDRLTCANLKLVVKIAHDFKWAPLKFSDIVAEGNIGLMVAVDRFDPSHNTKFSCYAAWWIKQAIRKAIQWNSKTVRVPSGSLHKIHNIRRAQLNYKLEHGEDPSIEELSDITGYSQKQIQSLISAVVDTLSIDEPADEEGASTLSQVISDSVVNPWQDDRVEVLRSALDKLPELDRYVVQCLFGIDCEKKYSLRDTAQEVGLPQSTVQEILNSALRSLRGMLEYDSGALCLAC